MNPTKRVLNVLHKMAKSHAGTDYLALADEAGRVLAEYEQEYPQENPPETGHLARCCHATAQRVWAAATELDRLCDVAEKIRMLANLATVEFATTSEANEFVSRYFPGVLPLVWSHRKDHEYPFVGRDSTPIALVRCVAKTASA